MKNLQYTPYLDLGKAKNPYDYKTRIDPTGKYILDEKQMMEEDAAIELEKQTVFANKIYKDSGAQQADKAEFADPTEKMTGKEIGGNAMANAGGILSMASQQYANFNTVSSSKKESKAQIAQGTMQGAGLGMKIAGPKGAAVGGLVGLGLGLLDSKADSRKRTEEADQNVRKDFRDIKKDREQSYFSNYTNI